MKRWLVAVFSFFAVSACFAAVNTDPVNPLVQLKPVYEQALLEPKITKYFNRFVDEVSVSPMITVRGEPEFANMKRLDKQSKQMVAYIKKHYPQMQALKIYTFVGKDEYNSCYQYYHSLSKSFIGKSCHNFSESFSNCSLCNRFVTQVRSHPRHNIINAVWMKDDQVTSLVKKVNLLNGDSAYVGLEIDH